ncbi:MAG: M23 family metallopeptidase [Mariprofundus sp.]|nr:M23 family metallopeptidase [Mariprofundus sp.]
MVIIFRLSCLILLLALAACISTPTPTYKTHNSSKYSTHNKHSHNSKPVLRYVRANDTLYSIGKKFGIDYRLIAKRNHIRYPYKIYLGQRLYIDRHAPRRNDLTAIKIKNASKKSHKKASKKTIKRKTHQKKVKRIAKSSHRNKAKGYKGQLRWPVKGIVTSKFGRRGSRMHDGIDIGAKEGTRVYAAASGEVVYADSRLSGYGKLIIIRHGKNLFTAYGHNRRMLVRKGAKVRAGDVIAQVGHTGRASGPHLHFEVRQGSTPVNPIAYLPHR